MISRAMKSHTNEQTVRGRPTLKEVERYVSERGRSAGLERDQFSVFTSHVVKAKNRCHSMNKVKNLGFAKWLIYIKKPRQGVCCFSFARYSQKCVIQIIAY